MVNLLKTILTNNPDALELFESIIDGDTLSSQEQSAIKFLLDNKEDLPSESYFIDKFPEYAHPLSVAKILDGNDIKVEFKQLLKNRHRLVVSSKLSALATKAATSDINSLDIDTLRQSIFISESQEQLSIETSSDFIDFYTKRRNRPVGLKTYIDTLDDAICGLAPGTLSVVAAHVGNYKTMFSANLAYKNTRWNNYNVCYISLEVPKNDLLINLLCRHSADTKFDKYEYLSHRAIRQNTLDVEQDSYLLSTIVPDFFDNPNNGILKILDETDFKTLAFEEIRQKLEEVDDYMREQTRDKDNPEDKGHGLDAVIVDHINLCKFNGDDSKKFSSEYAEGNAYVSFFRKLSLNFRRVSEDEVQKLAVIIVSQINRTGWENAQKSKTHKGEYTLNALAEFNELERAAQYVITIYTTEEMKALNEARIQLLKNRNGPTVESFSIFVNPEAYTVKEGTELYGGTIPDIETAFNGAETISVPIEELMNSAGAVVCSQEDIDAMFHKNISQDKITDKSQPQSLESSSKFEEDIDSTL